MLPAAGSVATADPSGLPNHRPAGSHLTRAWMEEPAGLRPGRLESVHGVHQTHPSVQLGSAGPHLKGERSGTDAKRNQHLCHPSHLEGGDTDGPGVLGLCEDRVGSRLSPSLGSSTVCCLVIII